MMSEEKEDTFQNETKNSAPDTEGEEATEKQQVEELVTKKGSTTSVIWNWFGYLRSDKEQVNAICKVCRRTVPSKTGNTTSLFNHLKKYHEKQWYDSQGMRFHHARLPGTSANRQRTAGLRGSVLRDTPASSSSAKQTTLQSAFDAATPYKKKIDRVQEHNESSDVLAR